jgi:hypothetical protein
VWGNVNPRFWQLFPQKSGLTLRLEGRAHKIRAGEKMYVVKYLNAPETGREMSAGGVFNWVCEGGAGQKKSVPAKSAGTDLNRVVLFTEAKTLDERTVLVNVFFGVVSEEAAALAHHREERAARRVVFFGLAEVVREALDAVSQEGHLHFGVARVVGLFAVLRHDFGDFLFAVIDCHFFE